MENLANYVLAAAVLLVVYGVLPVAEVYLSETRWWWPGLLLPGATLVGGAAYFVYALNTPFQLGNDPRLADGVQMLNEVAGGRLITLGYMAVAFLPAAVLLLHYGLGRWNVLHYNREDAADSRLAAAEEKAAAAPAEA